MRQMPVSLKAPCKQGLTQSARVMANSLLKGCSCCHVELLFGYQLVDYLGSLNWDLQSTESCKFNQKKVTVSF